LVVFIAIERAATTMKTMVAIAVTEKIAAAAFNLVSLS